MMVLLSSYTHTVCRVLEYTMRRPSTPSIGGSNGLGLGGGGAKIWT